MGVFQSIVSVAGYAAIGIGLLVVAWWAVKRFWPAAATSTAGTAIGNVADKASEVAAVAGLETALLLCWTRGDKDGMTAVVAARDKIIGFIPPTTVPPVSPTGTATTTDGKVVQIIVSSVTTK